MPGAAGVRWYYRAVLLRAFRDWWGFFGVNKRSSFFWITTLIGFLVLWYWQGSKTAMGEMMVSLSALAAIGIMSIILFAWKLICAPVRLAQGQFIELQERSRERDDAIAKLHDLNEARISMEFLEITVTDPEDNPVPTATLVLIGKSLDPQKVELRCTGVKVKSPGSGSIEIITRQPALKFIIHKGERHPVDALKYDWKHGGADIQVLIPSNITSKNLFRGEEFIVTFVAFGTMNPVELNLLCSYSDTYGLQVQTVRTQSTVGILDS